MSDEQVMLISAAMGIILLATIAGWREWLPSGVFKTVVLFLAGAVPIVLLFLAKFPTKWFAGTAWGFGLGAMILSGAFSGRTASEKSFRVPFLSGFGLALLALNLWAHV
jgi:hypothetical protein